MLSNMSKLKELCGRRCSWNWFERELRGRVREASVSGIFVIKGKEL